MTTIGIFFGSNTGKSERIAHRIKRELKQFKTDVHNIRFAAPHHFEQYAALVLITSTWGSGDLQDDWCEFDRFLDGIDFSKKKVSFIGLGDQDTYPDSFADGVGMLYQRIAHKAASVIGYTPIDSYQFQQSRAVVDGQFIGLILDEENQPERTEKRIVEWVSRITDALI